MIPFPFQTGGLGYVINQLAGGDPYWGSTVALLHMDGSNGSATFTDSTGRHTFTRAGNAQISTTLPKFGTGSGLFDGTGDWVATTDMTDFQMGTGDFTIEGWLKTTANNRVLVEFRVPATNGFVCYVNSSGFLGCFMNIGSSVNVDSSTTCNNGAWRHFAFSRNSGTMRVFLDGTQVASGTMSANMNLSSQCRIGADAAGSLSWNGNLDDIRITKGVGRYTSNFTPPVAAYPDG